MTNQCKKIFCKRGCANVGGPEGDPKGKGETNKKKKNDYQKLLKMENTMRNNEIARETGLTLKKSAVTLGQVKSKNVVREKKRQLSKGEIG